LLSVPSTKHNDPAKYSQFAALVIISISYQTAAPIQSAEEVHGTANVRSLFLVDAHQFGDGRMPTTNP
jgi:hypothetical protein